jgi:Protein of unknown function (DUF3455)
MCFHETKILVEKSKFSRDLVMSGEAIYAVQLENKQMRYNLGQQSKKTARVRSLFVAALVLGCAFGTVARAAAQKITTPTTPPAITPPAGNSAFLAGHAVGTQGYVCLPTSTGASWTVNGSRPEATLFGSLFGQGDQIINHFLSPDTTPNEFAPNPLPFGSPTWQSSLDSSVVWAKALTPSVAAGSNASCPNAGAISCLLLQSIGSQKGPTGGKQMTQTTFIQRLNTTGGSAPSTGCSGSADVGKQTLVPYTADYYFFHKDQ